MRSTICVSLAEPSFEACSRALDRTAFAEIRLDRMRLSRREIEQLFSGHPRLIATCRRGVFPERTRIELLETAVRSGAAFLDLEHEAAAGAERLLELAREVGCRVILSHHDARRTPPRGDLERIMERCASLDEIRTDLVKIACLANSRRDCARMLGLLEHATPEARDCEPELPGMDRSPDAPPPSARAASAGRHDPGLVIVPMGALGTVARVVAPLLGSHHTYACLARGRETAPGQLDLETHKRLAAVLEAARVPSKPPPASARNNGDIGDVSPQPLKKSAIVRETTD